MITPTSLIQVSSSMAEIAVPPSEITLTTFNTAVEGGEANATDFRIIGICKDVEGGVLSLSIVHRLRLHEHDPQAIVPHSEVIVP